MRNLFVSRIQPVLAAAIFSLAACGGGGGGGGVNNVTPQDDNAEAPQALAYNEVAPVLQAKCVGCHNSGNNPLAPFSLDGEQAATAFKSAINYTVDSQTMPPPGVPGLTATEHAQLMSWSGETPYEFVRELLHISLIEAEAWDIMPRNRDVLFEQRPDEIDCARDTGWLVEDDELEIRTEFCNYAGLSQQSLLQLEAGTELELAMSHSQLNFNAPSEANLAISIAGSLVWERTIPIPAASAVIKERITLPFDVSPGDAIGIHVYNHGDNAYTIHSLDALVWNDQELTICPTYDSTFEAIQATVFEQAGCANSLCHGEAAEGGLDLRPDVAFDNLVGVPAQGSSLLLVDPRNPATSYLYHKLSAKTFPGSYAIDGAAMPSAGEAISAGQLEAIRLWIEAGSPKDGSVGDTLGRGEDEIERLLGVCLPEAEAVNTIPLPPPEPDRGVQFSMAPHEVPAESEREICFAVYEDFRDQVPPQFMTEDREFIFVKSNNVREDAFTHHNILFHSPVPVEMIHDPSFGEWTCAPDSPRAGEACEPTDKASCGEGGQCRAVTEEKIACRGYGPRVTIEVTAPDGTAAEIFGSVAAISTDEFSRDGFYQLIPSHGLFYWNSHAFNLTNEDGIHHVWRNFEFADDRRFRAESVAYVSNIYAATGTPPFEKQTVCRDFLLDEGDGLLSMSSHTHKRGERFFTSVKGGEQIYETFTYDEPLVKPYDPVMVFNNSDPQERTLEYCATYNNGVNADGSPNIETVTRLSRRPDNSPSCTPLACVAGNIGAPCSGADDDAACDSSPGAGDGWCDACPITTGASSDDEMFVLLLTRLGNHDALIHQLGGNASVAITSPTGGDSFAAGDTVNMEFEFMNFDLAPPESHGEHDHGGGDSHGDDHDGNHGNVSAGHYHVYLDTEDDDADHLTAWTETAGFELPTDIEPGEHVIRVSLRAPDHHPVGAEARITIVVE